MDLADAKAAKRGAFFFTRFPVATETFRLETRPAIGRLTSRSQRAATPLPSPVSSRPMTRARWPSSPASYDRDAQAWLWRTSEALVDQARLSSGLQPGGAPPAE